MFTSRGLRILITCLLALFIMTTFAEAQSRFVEPPSNQTKLIVFVHGLGNSGGGDALTAWSTGPGAENWPKVMQQDQVFSRNFAIFVYQYETDRFRGNFPIQGLSDELKARIRAEADINKFDEIYFIAHSLGGIVVRNYLLIDPEVRAKTKSIFLFATPMGGSELARAATALGLGSVQTAQLGGGPDNPDAVFNTIKDDWYRHRITIPSYCAYETERTGVVLIVPRSSVEPLCSHAVTPLRGNHSNIVAPPRSGPFLAHDLMRRWLAELLPDFEEAAKASEKDNRIVIANCNGNEAYRGPYGRVHTRLKDALSARGVQNVRYSLPLSQTWSGDRSKSAIFQDQEPTHVIIHLSCFQNTKEDDRLSLEKRDRNFISFLRSFQNSPTRIITYSRSFKTVGCPSLREKLRLAGLAESYRGRLVMVAIDQGEVPGESGPGDEYLFEALGIGRAMASTNDCLGARRG